MKKLTAILLIAVYLFNLLGYSVVFSYFSSQTDRALSQQLDQNNYKDSDLVQLSIPLHLPYMQNTNGFERIDGTVESGGVQYNYVKRRIHNDTLYIMCIPNQQKANLAKEKSRYAGAVNDFGTAKKGKESAAKKSGPAAEYNNLIVHYNLVLNANSRVITGETIASALTSVAHESPEHPPQAAC